MLFDTHAHFDAFGSGEERAAAVDRAVRAGVGAILAVGGSEAANRAAIETAARFPGLVSAALGLDRDQAPAGAGPAPGTGDEGIDGWLAGLAASLDALLTEAGERGVRPVAVGEIGIDCHYHPGTAESQRLLLRLQLEAAARRGLPAIVHSREADALTLEELARFREARGHGDRIGVLHCFTGTRDFARALLDLGFHIGFSGILTFRNAGPLRDVAREIPEERLLVETDTPYLAPEPRRGQRNEPSFLPHVAGVLAAVRGCPASRIAEITAANARRLFFGEVRTGRSAC